MDETCGSSQYRMHISMPTTFPAVLGVQDENRRMRDKVLLSPGCIYSLPKTAMAFSLQHHRIQSPQKNQHTTSQMICEQLESVLDCLLVCL